MKTEFIDEQVIAVLLKQRRSRRDTDQAAVQEARHRRCWPSSPLLRKGRTRCAPTEGRGIEASCRTQPPCSESGESCIHRNARGGPESSVDPRPRRHPQSSKSKRDCSRRWPRAIRRVGWNRMRPSRIAQTASATVGDSHGRTGFRNESTAGISCRQTSGIEIPSSVCSTRFPLETVNCIGIDVIADQFFVHFCAGRDVGQRCLGYVRLEIIMHLLTYRHGYPGMRSTPRQWQSCTQCRAV